MRHSREGPRGFWLASGERSAEARDHFISVWIRLHVGTSRRIFRLLVGKNGTEQRDHSCFWPRLYRSAMHSTVVRLVLPRLRHNRSEAKQKTNRQELTTVFTDLHSNANQASVANHDRATLLRENQFSCRFAYSGSFQLPSVRHATLVTRSTRFLTEVGRRGASLISSHAETGTYLWSSAFGHCFFHDRPTSRSPLHAAESTGTSTCSKQCGKAIQEVHVVWVGWDAVASAKLCAESCILRWSKYRSLANACSVRAREQVSTVSNNGYDRQQSEHTDKFVRYWS
jgi:hypothetical protein